MRLRTRNMWWCLLTGNAIPTVITTGAKFLKKFLKCIRAIKGVEIDLLTSSTVPQVIVKVMKVVDIGLKRPATTP